MLDYIVVLGATTLVAVTFHAFRLPPIVAFFAAGALVGPHGLKWVQSPPNMHFMSETASLLLMFTIGLEFSLKKLSQLGQKLLLLGFSQVALCVFVFTSLLTFAFHIPFERALFFSFLVSLSSTAVVLKLLTDHRDFETPHGKTSFSILLSQDLAVIPMIIAIPFLNDINQMASSIYDSLLPMTLLAVLGLIFFVAFNKYVLPTLLFRVASTGSREVFFYFVLFIFASLAVGLEKIGLSLSLGAFLAGMLIAGSPYGKQATADFVPLRDAFLGLFFVVTGMLLDTHFALTNIHKIFAFGFGILALKVMLIFSLVWFFGHTGTVSRITSLLVFQFGEFGFVLADQGLKLGLLTQKELQYFIAISIVSLVATPFVYRMIPYLSNPQNFDKFIPMWLYSNAKKIRSNLLHSVNAIETTHTMDPHNLSQHVIIIGFGVAGQSLAKVLKFMSIPYIVIETNSETVRQFSTSEPIIFGDASSVDILERASAENAKLITVVTSSVSTLEPILNSIRKICAVDIPIIVRTNYLQDLKRFEGGGNTRFVVGELETTQALLNAVLESSQVDPITIDNLTRELRSDIQQKYTI